MQPPLIALDCERMRHPNTGLYHFCWHLSRALQRQLPKQYQMAVYLSEDLGSVVEAGMPILPQHFWHRWLLHPAPGTALWHCTNQGSAYFPYGAKCKIVLTVHDLNFLYDERKSATKKNRYLQKLNAKLLRADAIVAISEYVKQDLLRHTRADAAKISVIYNGSNINSTIKPEPPAHQPSAPFLFTIGTIIDKKNFHVLPGMLVGNKYVLVLAGIVQSESYKARIMEEARRLGVQDRVLFTGAVSEAQKYWYLQQCAAFVFPSLSEGFGLPVIEAMHFGKPVLLSGATSLPEVGGPYAYYFESFEPAHMSRLATDAIQDVQLHKKQPAIQRWAARFSWNDAAKAYCAIYGQLLS
jgi:glycosyltransferase involved in cell wall biosynthesis